MVRAAARGAVDFAAARPDRAAWWLALGLVMDEVEGDDVTTVCAERNRVDLALVASGACTPEWIEKIVASAGGRVDTIARMLRPWDATASKPAADLAATMKAAWIETWGSPDSPETQAAIAWTVADLKARNQQK